LTQRRTVPAETPARSATWASVSEPVVDDVAMAPQFD
jgi:hypothetical protein